jgi:dimethylamine/trimethylamine dehydrogenase
MHEVIALMAELPDLWDDTVGLGERLRHLAIHAGGIPGALCRRHQEADDEAGGGVGRFTSDTMASQVRRGILDLIGAARPSIADPFLPNNIAEGRIEDIRECIGCNICITGDMTMSPSRCTQNPTMAEEWRKGWHPERIRPQQSEANVLIVGGGPAGLECARALGRRGYKGHWRRRARTGDA